MGADRALRAVLVLAAAAAVLLDAPVWATTVLSLAATTAVGQRLASRRGRGLPDAVLVGIGGVLVVLVVTGFSLDVVGVPLRSTGWALALGALGLVALAAPSRGTGPHQTGPRQTEPQDAGSSDARGPRRGGELLRVLPWGVASVAMLVLALSLSVRSTDSVAAAPVQLSLGELAPATAEVVVASDVDTGLLELRADPGTGATLSYPLFRLEAGGSRTTQVVLAVSGRTVITISNPGQSRPLRSLVVDR